MGRMGICCALAGAVALACPLAGFGAADFSDSFTNLSGWTDLSKVVKWGAGSGSTGVSAFDNSGGKVTLTSTAITYSGYVNTNSLKTFTALDKRFAAPINHKTNLVTIDFQAYWPTIPANNGEAGRFAVVLNYDYQPGGLDLTPEGQAGSKVSDFSQEWWARPAYHLRIRNGSNGGTTMLQYGGGSVFGGEFESTASWWLPGFISGAGGVSPGSGPDFPANSWVQTVGHITSTDTDFRAYQYVVAPDYQQVWYDADDNGVLVAGEKRAEMPLPLTHASAPYYEYIEHFEGIRLYWRGASNLNQQAVLDSLSLTVTALDMHWDADGNAGNGAGGGSGNWQNAVGATWRNNPTFNVEWDNPSLNPAIFGGTAGTVNVVGTVTPASMTFNTSYTLQGAGTVQMAGGTIAANALVTITSGLALSGNVNKTGAQAVQILGAQNHAPGTELTVSGGTVVFGTDAGASGAVLTVNAQGPVSFINSRNNLAGLLVGAGHTVQINVPGKAVITPLLAMGGTDAVDLRGGALVVKGGNLAAMQAEAKAAFDAGYGAGSTVLWSLTAWGDPTKALGIAPGSAVGTVNGETLAAGDVAIKLTWGADANLDGKVDVGDLGILASNWNGTGKAFHQADFNFDGLVNVGDLGRLASLWNSGVGSPLSLEEAMALFPELAGVTVPEPASVGLLALGAVGLLRRKR